MSDTSVFVFEDPADATRIWFRDPLHAPRALPRLCTELWARVTSSANGLEPRIIRSFVYFSPRTMAPPPAAPPLPPGQAAANWRTHYLPRVETAYAAILAPDYTSLTPEQLVSLLDQQFEQTIDAIAGTIAAAMEIGPDAERLSNLLESRLGAEGELLSATILHGGGSETASLGRDVRRLAEAARNSPGVASLLEESRFAAAVTSPIEPWAGALRDFLHDHTDEIALWTELYVPAWNEDPLPLMRLVAATLASPERKASTTPEEAVVSVRARLPAADIPEFEAALALSRDYVPVIEHRARWQLKLIGALRRPLLALGEQLLALGAVSAADDVFFLTPEELHQAARGRDLRELAAERRASWVEDSELEAPITLGLPIPWEMFGAMNSTLKRMFGAVAIALSTASLVTGIGASRGVARGRARIVHSLAEAEELLDGDILVCPTTSPPWTPYFAVCAAVVTDSGGMLSHAAIEAREYGIPAVVGTRDATRKIPEGATVIVDGDAGTVTIEP